MSDKSGKSLSRRGLLRRGTVMIGASAFLVGFGSQYDTGVDAPTPTPSPSPTPTATPVLTPTPEAMTPFDASTNDRIPDVTPIENEIHQLTNEARKKHDRGTVQWSDDLAYVARDHSRDMAKRDFFAHENPDGERAWNRTARYGLGFKKIGENIALSGATEGKTTEEIAEHVFLLWMTSEEGHRENLLRDRHTHHGSGVYMTEKGINATQLFGVKS